MGVGGSVKIKNSIPQTGDRLLATTTVAVAGLTTIGKVINTTNMEELRVDIINGTVIFDAFSIQVSIDDGASYTVLFDTAVDFGSPEGRLIGSDDDLVTLAAATLGSFELDCTPYDYVRVQASADTNPSVGVTGKWGGK